MKNLTKSDMMDYVTGAVIMGCGGGGAAWETKMIDEAFEKGWEFKLMDISQVDDSKILCILAGVGGGVLKRSGTRSHITTRRLTSDPTLG